MGNYKIDIKDSENPILLTKSILYKVIEAVKKSKKEIVKMEIGALVETQYLKYLVAIFRSNREFQMAYRLSQAQDVDAETIGRILKLQFLLLRLDDKKCFEKVRIAKSNTDAAILYWFLCTPEFYRACQRDSERFDLSSFG